MSVFDEPKPGAVLGAIWGLCIWMIILMAIAVVLTGCASVGNQEVKNWQNKFYEQQRATDVIQVANFSEILVTGAEGGATITLRMPLQPLSVIPQNSDIVNSIERMVKAGALAYGAVQIADGIAGAGEVTVVEQPAPIPVEKPIFIPAPQ